MTVTLQQLLQRNDPGIVVERLIMLYMDQGGLRYSYLAMYQKLIHLEPVTNAGSYTDNMRIVVSEVPPDEFDSTGYTDVGGRNGKTKRQSWQEDNDCATIHNPEDPMWDTEEGYGLDFTPWNEWLSMPLDEKSLETYPETDLLAHCLWEMSFLGFDETKIGDQLQEIKDTIERIKDGTEPLYSMDEVRDRLNKFTDGYEEDPPSA